VAYTVLCQCVTRVWWAAEGSCMAPAGLAQSSSSELLAAAWLLTLVLACDGVMQQWLLCLMAWAACACVD
jgi:hypothetical protein